ncbi:MAG: hypothetical protein LBR17_06175 [Bacteroidales bacterium]|nr:hypothetical protein [Bacteroidales bacterium]
MKKILLLLSITSISFFAIGQIDNKSKTDTLYYNYSLDTLDNYYVFKYFCKLIGAAENTKWIPMHFEIRLPKTFKEITGAGEYFVFLFRQNQDLIMYYKYEDYNDSVVLNLDTVYEPTKKELESIFCNLSFEGKNYYYEKIKISKKRKNFIIKRKGVTFILYNIKNKNVDMFMKAIDSFKILRPYGIEYIE